MIAIINACLINRVFEFPGFARAVVIPVFFVACANTANIYLCDIAFARAIFIYEGDK